MALAVLYKGESKNPSFIIKNADGDVITHANITDVIVKLLVNKSEVAQYKKVTAAGYLDLVQEATEGMYSIPIERSQTKDWATGKLVIDVQVKTVNANLTEGYFNALRQEAYEIQDHSTNNDTI